MTVAQTTQLIQLILNAVLLLAISVAWWGLVWMRSSTVSDRLSRLQGIQPRAVNPRWLSMMRCQYRLSRVSVGVMNCVLVGLSGSLLGLSLRTLIHADWLISLAMVLFAGGAAGLLASIGLTLLEFYRRSPRQRVRPKLNSVRTGFANRAEFKASKPDRTRLPPRPTHQSDRLTG